MEPIGSTFFYVLAGFVGLSLLYKGGNRPLPLLLLELGAVAILLAMLFNALARRSRAVALPGVVWIAIGSLLAYPLLQLVPLPPSLWASLPGHGVYASIAARFAAEGAPGVWRGIAVVPSDTLAGWLALMPPLAAFLGVTQLSTRNAGRLLVVLASVAALVALYGLFQVGTSALETFPHATNERAFGTATGTFANRNHFAALLAMMLPVLIGLLVTANHGGFPRNATLRPSESHAQRVLLFAAATTVLLCLLFTRSRAGIATALVGLVFTAVLLFRASRVHARGAPGRWALAFVAALIGVSVLLAFAIGVTPIVSNMTPERLHLGAATRLSTYIGTITAAVEFLPFGSGLATFASVYPRFQLAGGLEHAGVFVNAAHNEYLQAFMEMGIAGIAICALFLVGYVQRMAQLASRESARRFDMLQLAAGAALLPMILHSLFDFPLHIPANAIWYATLAGVLFHRSSDPSEAAGAVTRGAHSGGAPESHRTRLEG